MAALDGLDHYNRGETSMNTASERTDAQSAVTVIGLGEMGFALAGAFLDGGHPTTVWNGTSERADPLVARGG
ncbi:hypothetical protein GCM10010219_42900 [Streptomyces netropsis]|nr:hypothetical protein GCM10010219_42900 [Streptomyces netropsis]